jgi:hypothetical protein
MANVQHGSDIAKSCLPASLFPRSGRAAATKSQSGAYSAPATPPDHPGPQGLVICAIKGRDLEAVAPADLSGLAIRDVWRPKFPPAERVREAAGLIPSVPAWRGEEGPRPRIVVSPGAIAVESHDLARLERSFNRQLDHAPRVIGQRALPAYNATYRTRDHELADRGQVRAAARKAITEWSRKSRGRMFRAFSELDYGPLLALPGLPATCTVTYPGDWVTVAPDGQAAKRHWRMLKRRWLRAWGTPLRSLWKFEFQRRGAPHYAFYCVTPTTLSPDGKQFRHWLSDTWASIVAHPDPEERRKHRAAGTNVDYAEGLRSRDPKRIAVYFSKHGLFAAKEYQNQVPVEWQEPGKGPGRFWGYTGLKRCTAAAEVTHEHADMAGRTLRRWARAQHSRDGMPLYRIARVRRADTVTGLVRHRKVKRRPVRLANGHGWVSVNDAPKFAETLARYLTT